MLMLYLKGDFWHIFVWLCFGFRLVSVCFRFGLLLVSVWFLFGFISVSIWFHLLLFRLLFGLDSVFYEEKSVAVLGDSHAGCTALKVDEIDVGVILWRRRCLRRFLLWRVLQGAPRWSWRCR